ncbi:MAG: hypothetical protein RSA62_03610 [Oscillospiraceae bacterium]
MLNIRNTRDYIENFLKIRTKEGKIVPFRFNPSQNKMYRELKAMYAQSLPLRIIILKARQLGFSTLTEGIIYKLTATNENVRALIVAHREDSTANLFQMSKLFYDKSPMEIKPMMSGSNAQELVFENPDKNPERRAENPGLNSRIRCNTAGGGGIGRSDTLMYVHASEYAFWRGKKEETLSGILQAVPNLPGTLVVIESTANGFDAFKDIWDASVAGQNDFLPLFFAWFDNPEYTMAASEDTVWTEEEIKIKERFGLNFGQLSWRRWCIRNNCHNSEDTFKQEYPSTPDEAFLMSGKPVFDNAKIMELRSTAATPLHVGEFEYSYDERSIKDIRWVDKADGAIKIYREPQNRLPYVLGGDTAGEGSDWFTGLVIDNISGQWCAVMHRQFGEPEYVRQMFCLGTYYNFALIGPECNFSTYPTTRLSELHYPKLYVRERSDTFSGKTKESYGFRTDGITRPVIIAKLVELFRDHPELFIDFDTLGEMLSFCKNENERPEALSGKHDDLVMGLAITYAIRGQQRFTESAVAVDMKNWTQDMIDDYETASEAEKAFLRKRWENWEA